MDYACALPGAKPLRKRGRVLRTGRPTCAPAGGVLISARIRTSRIVERRSSYVVAGPVWWYSYGFILYLLRGRFCDVCPLRLVSSCAPQNMMNLCFPLPASRLASRHSYRPLTIRALTVHGPTESQVSWSCACSAATELRRDDVMSYHSIHTHNSERPHVGNGRLYQRGLPRANTRRGS